MTNVEPVPLRRIVARLTLETIGAAGLGKVNVLRLPFDPALEFEDGRAVPTGALLVSLRKATGFKVAHYLLEHTSFPETEPGAEYPFWELVEAAHPDHIATAARA